MTFGGGVGLFGVVPPAVRCTAPPAPPHSINLIPHKQPLLLRRSLRSWLRAAVADTSASLCLSCVVRCLSVAAAAAAAARTRAAVGAVPKRGPAVHGAAGAILAVRIVPTGCIVPIARGAVVA